jgi:hypothetical protein
MTDSIQKNENHITKSYFCKNCFYVDDRLQQCTKCEEDFVEEINCVKRCNECGFILAFKISVGLYFVMVVIVITIDFLIQHQILTTIDCWNLL